ncbi:FecR family protein [Fodinibius roseus]|uniref:FecR family protein n=1 Tax=Fodinibius roseus TaxID=1194090 RepID=A0A1M5L717_9BACT|nr:FecR domain-containing protein [Fodinibius roseus]SHG60715.1 FecR family protein [Fodinibius roseus]
MKRDLAEKFINNNCTKEEAEQVLNWLSTPEGQGYLEKKIEDDISLLQDKRIRALVPEAKSEQIWTEVKNSLGYGDKYQQANRKKHGLHWRSVAAVVVILTSAMFYVWSQSSSAPEPEPEPIHYAAGENEQRVITLGDGSEIRLNSNSEIWISGTFGEPVREVRLNGEAFFEVVHDEDRPFLIHTPNASVKDLGTAFNVKAFPGDDNVQVAVTEGKVTLWSEQQTEEEAAELNPGQFGFLSLTDHSIEIDEFKNNNYLSWMNGRMEFDDMPLREVSKQLNRIYGVSFEYANRQLEDLVLSADFERDSLDKALEVIALTLEIDYRMQGDVVQWQAKN